MKKLLIITLLLCVILLSGCTSFQDGLSELFNTKPYISHVSSDKEFYTSGDGEIKLLLKIKNPTPNDYSPVKLGVIYPEGVTPVDRNLRNNKLIELTSIKSNEEKSYFVAFTLDDRNIVNESLQFKFTIYNLNNQKFDIDKLNVLYTTNS